MQSFSLLYISTNIVAILQPHPNKGTDAYIFPLGMKESIGFLRYNSREEIGIIKIIHVVYKQKYKQIIKEIIFLQLLRITRGGRQFKKMCIVIAMRK